MKAIPAAHEFKIDALIAVGGGSTMDTAKGVAIVGETDAGGHGFQWLAAVKTPSAQDISNYSGTQHGRNGKRSMPECGYLR